MSKEISLTNIDGVANLKDEDFNEIMWQRVEGVRIIVEIGYQKYQIIGFDNATNSYVLIIET